MINSLLSELKIETKFLNGKRVTDKKTMEVVEKVLSGSVNNSIVNAINKQGGKGIGLSGKDASLLLCEQEDPQLGFVGRIKKVNHDIISSFIQSDFIPIIAPIGSGNDGQAFNINGDTAAGSLAESLKADRLLLLTDIEGVKSKAGNIIQQLNSDEARELIETGIITEGMIPKVNTSLAAIENGVKASVIIDGRVDHACLLELFTEHGAGTLFKNNP
jgi:acetylglutamate kinase